jgi:hypothetical protein
MERRHTLTSLPGGWSLSLVLPWICLLLVASACAYGVQLTAAVMVPSTPADRRDWSHQALLGHNVTEQRALLLHAALAPSSRMVLITGYEATTGDQMQVECATDGYRVASDALLVDLNDFRDVAAAVCIAVTAQ